MFRLFSSSFFQTILLFTIFFCFSLFPSLINGQSCDQNAERAHLLSASAMSPGSSCGLLFANGSDFPCNTPITKSLKSYLYNFHDNDPNNASMTGNYFIDGNLIVQPDSLYENDVDPSGELFVEGAYAVQALAQLRANYLTWPEGRAINPINWFNTYSCLANSYGMENLPNTTITNWKPLQQSSSNVNSPNILGSLFGLAAPLIGSLLDGLFDSQSIQNNLGSNYKQVVLSAQCKNDLTNGYGIARNNTQNENVVPLTSSASYKHSGAAGAGMNTDNTRIHGNTRFATSFTFACKNLDGTFKDDGSPSYQLFLGQSFIVAENIDQDLPDPGQQSSFSLDSFLTKTINVASVVASQVIFPAIFSDSPSNLRSAQYATQLVGGSLNAIINEIL